MPIPSHLMPSRWLPFALVALLAGGASVAAGIWGFPWIVPLRIVEGPYLQSTTETTTTVVWWTIRPSQCELVIAGDGGERVLRASGTDWRTAIHVDGLEAGKTYPYRVRSGMRTLAEGTIHTNPPAGQPVRFVVFGDSGRGTREQYQLAEQMRKTRPDFLLHTGDLVYPGGDRNDYAARFFAPYRTMLSDLNFWPSLGNHDIGGDDKATPYRAVFELPHNGPKGLPAEDNYWFDFASLRIAVIDSNLEEDTLASKVAPWLGEVFATAGERWRLVVFHHPPYSIGKHGCDERIQRALVPAIESAGVHLVFNGHDHLYCRTVPLLGGAPVGPGQRGVVYVVSGSGGAALYETKKLSGQAPIYPVYNNSVHSFSLVVAAGDAMRFQQIDVDGNVLDEWSLSRSVVGVTTTQPQ